MEAVGVSTTTAVSPPAVALKLMSDERLARWAAKGSQAAFGAIFERHHQALHRYCQSIVGNGHDAADALQNTMLKALRALPGEKRTIALKPWLYRIAHNESISLLRARRGDSNLDAAEHLGDAGAESIVESRERLRDLSADLQQLTEQQRGALLMRELGDLEFSEVGAALQVSATAAKQSVYEARCALQSMQDGRAMDCDVVRRTLSDGDRRTLRNMKLRGHLRACMACREFEAALRHRPAHLAALTPVLPLAAAASMLHGLLGAGAGTGAGHGGGGLLAGIALGAKSSSALSLGTAKIASVVAIAGGAAGGAAYTVPGEPANADGRHVSRPSAPAPPGAAAPFVGSDQRSARASRRFAPAPARPAAARSVTSAEKPRATTALHRPTGNSARAPAGHARSSASVAGATRERGRRHASAEIGDGVARRAADGTPASGAGASDHPARPAAGAAPEATSATTPLSAAAAASGGPVARGEATAADIADTVVPAAGPRAR